MGEKLKYFIEFLLIVYHFGTTLSYIIFFQSLFSDIFVQMNYKIPNFIRDLFIFLILLPMGFTNNVHLVYKNSMFGVFCLFVTCLIILITNIGIIYKNQELKSINHVIDI